MATVIDSLVVTLGLNATGFTTGVKRADADFRATKESANRAAMEISAAGKKAAEFFGKLRNEALSLAAVFVGGMGVKSLIEHLTTTDAATGRLARNLNITTEALTAWEGVAERAGGTAGGVVQTFEGLTRAYQEYQATGQMAAAPFLQRLGINNPNELNDIPAMLLKIADTIQRTRMDPRQANFLLESAGISDAGLRNAIIKGRASLTAALEESRRLGVASKADTDAAEKLAASFDKVKQAVISVARTILTDLSPSIEGILNDVAAWLSRDENKEWLKQEIHRITDAIKEFAGEFGGVVGNVWKWLSRDENKEWLRSEFLRLKGELKELWTDVNKVVQLFGGWENVLKAIVLIKLTAWIAGVTAAFGPLGLAVAAIVAGMHEIERFRDEGIEGPGGLASLPVGSPLWANVPEKEQANYRNSPRSQREMGWDRTPAQRALDYLRGGSSSSSEAPSETMPWQRQGPAPPVIQTVQVKSKGGAVWNVAPEYAEKFQGLIDDLDARGIPLTSGGGYNRREIRGYEGTGRWSSHAFGAGIDVNPGTNPLGGASTMPADIAELAAKHGLLWGGVWKNRPDPMHFEIRGDPRREAETSTGWDANNPLNLTTGGGWQGDRRTTSAGLPIRAYASMEEGIADTVNKLVEYQQKRNLTTVEQMAREWNKTATPEYVSKIAASLGVRPNESFDIRDPAKAAAWIRAAQPLETGPGRLTETQIANGVRRGLGGLASSTNPAEVPHRMLTREELAPAPLSFVPRAGQAYRSAAAPVSNVSSDTRIGTINVHTAATDANGIARGLGPALERYGLVSQANVGLA